MIKRRIPEYLQDCPQGWRNFIADMQLRIEPDEDGGFKEVTIQAELDKYRAFYEGGDLIFTDERMYNLFLLKYSEAREYHN